MVELLGWCSSLILLATIIQQIRTQLRERSTKGVSRWLFVGQTAASAGFTAYSFLVHNWVFTATNASLLLAALFGSLITLRARRNSLRPPEAHSVDTSLPPSKREHTTSQVGHFGQRKHCVS